jgi:hypothetical protein
LPGLLNDCFGDETFVAYTDRFWADLSRARLRRERCGRSRLYPANKRAYGSSIALSLEPMVSGCCAFAAHDEPMDTDGLIEGGVSAPVRTITREAR